MVAQSKEQPTWDDIIDTSGNDITAALLAIGRKVQECKLGFLPSIWSFDLIDHSWLGLSVGLRTDELPFGFTAHEFAFD
jgi:hypothetical protein